MKGRMKGARACRALAVGLLLVACGEGDGEEKGERSVDGGMMRAGADDTASSAAFPSSERLCTLATSESVEADLRDVFGEPERVEQGPNKVLHYAFDDQSEWLFIIDANGVWSGYTVRSSEAEVSIPDCWVPDGGFWRRPDGGYWQRPDGGWR